MRSQSRGRVWCFALSAACLIAFVAIISGLADSLLPAGGASRKRALFSLLAYAVLAWGATGVIAMRPERRRPVLATVGGVLLALLFFDLTARWLELPFGLPRVGSMGMSSRTLHHRYPANQALRLGTGSGDIFTLRTNEDGLRSSYDRASFGARAPRIAIVGDSFVFGLGVRQGAEFPVLMEELLRTETDHAETAVLNAGVVSYSPYLERLLFTDTVKAYDPDLVLLLVDVTDIGDDLKYENEAITQSGRPAFDLGLDEAESFREFGPLWNLNAPLRKCFSLPFTILKRALRGQAPGEGYAYYHFDLMLGGQRETNQYFLYRHPLEVTRPYFERTLGNISALAASVAETGAGFATVIIPRFHHWNVAECPDNWEHASYALDEPHQYEYFRFFREAAATVDYPIHDLLPAFQDTEEFPLVLAGDPHWNEPGHAFVARLLTDYVVNSGLFAEAARR